MLRRQHQIPLHLPDEIFCFVTLLHYDVPLNLLSRTEQFLIPNCSVKQKWASPALLVYSPPPLTLGKDSNKSYKSD